MRHSTHSVGKSHCLACRAGLATGEAFSGIADMVRHAQAHREAITAFYDAGVNLSHYGKVDHLAPAGAMDDFVSYVQGQTRAEAEAFFADLLALARSHNVVVNIHIVHGEMAMQKSLGELGEKAAIYTFKD